MDILQTTTNVTYTTITNPLILIQSLTEISKKYHLIACDFEAASKYTDTQKEVMRLQLADMQEGTLDYHHLKQQIDSSGLSHPSLVQITHFSLAISETEAYVVIITSPKMQSILLNWLVTTETTQIWHDASFDFRLIYYHTRKFPLNYEDTQVLAKTILNHVNNQKSMTGLKHLMGYKYGAWAVSKDEFNLSQMFKEHVLHYAAIDACATFALWNEIQDSLKE